MFARHQFLLLLILKILGCHSLSLVAEYATRGIRGQVGFLQHGDDEVEVSANLKGAVKGEVFIWKIYQRPVLPYEPCTPAYYGEEVLDLSEEHGLLVVDSRITVGDLPLGELLERTLVLKSLTTLRVVCGVLRADVPVSTYGAKFISGVVGTLWFRQAISHDGVWTGVKASLVSGHKDIKAPVHITWTLFSRAYESEDVSLEHMREGCRGLGRYPGRVVHEALLPLQLGDLEHKGRSYEIEHLPDLRKLVVRHSVWMVVYDTSGTVLACARLFPVRPRRATAKITSPNNIEKGGIGGYIEVYQASPLDPVKLSINLTLPRSDAQAFGIDNFPAGQKHSCSSLSRRFYEPWSVDLDLTPAPQQGTPDLYPAGDLSGKFGTLTDLSHAEATLTDPMLTLYGRHSVIGRGVAVYDRSWFVVGCGDLVSTVPQITGVAKFEGQVTGVMHVASTIDSIFADTQVYLHLYKTGSEKDSIHHKWHVHAKPVDKSQDCGTAGGHFNPFNSSLTTLQKVLNDLPHEAYEIGDLAGKLGTVAIPGPKTVRSEVMAGRYFWTDESLPLIGGGSILNKAIVIHEENGGKPRIACANLLLGEITGSFS